MKRTKTEVQEEALTVFKAHNGRGILAMATGTGKSKIAIDYSAQKFIDNTDLRILIVVPTEKLRDVNWKDEFDKWNQSFLWNNNVERSCYVSISKIKGEVFDIVILDECHNITSENSKFFENNTVYSVLGLTATPPNDYIKRELLNKLNLNVIYRVTLDEAVEWGLVSPYKITVYYIQLDSVRKNVPAGNKQKPFFQSELSAYWYLTKKIDEINPIESSAAMLGKRKTLILKRMRLIYSLNSKTEAAQFLLKKVIPKDQRTLIFAGDISQAEKLCDHYFHSKSSDKDYNSFLQEEINILSSVRSLNEGQNIPNLDNALITQVNSNELHSIQRIGRIVRYRDDHVANIYILCVKGTVDEKWLQSAISEFDSTSISYEDFSKIKMDYD